MARKTSFLSMLLPRRRRRHAAARLQLLHHLLLLLLLLHLLDQLVADLRRQARERCRVEVTEAAARRLRLLLEAGEAAGETLLRPLGGDIDLVVGVAADVDHLLVVVL